MLLFFFFPSCLRRLVLEVTFRVSRSLLALENSEPYLSILSICFSLYLFYPFISHHAAPASISYACRTIVNCIRASSSYFSKGHMSNQVRDLCAICSFGVSCLPRKCPKIILVMWSKRAFFVENVQSSKVRVCCPWYLGKKYLSWKNDAQVHLEDNGLGLAIDY